MVYAADLKSAGPRPCGFESRPSYQHIYWRKQVNELDVIYPVFIIMGAVYVLARIVNMHQDDVERKRLLQEEIDRQKRINDLYGRK